MFLNDSFLQKENGFPLHKSHSIEMKMHKREILYYWHWKGRSFPLLWVQITKIIHSQDMISINPNTHRNRGVKIVPPAVTVSCSRSARENPLGTYIDRRFFTELLSFKKCTHAMAETCCLQRAKPLTAAFPVSESSREPGSVSSGHRPASAHSSPRTRSSAESFPHAHLCLRPVSML